MHSISGTVECGESEAADLGRQFENWLLRQSEEVSPDELFRLEALTDHDTADVAELVQIAFDIAAMYVEDGEGIPPALSAEVVAVRRIGGVSAAVRKAEIRGDRRADRALLAQLRAEVEAGQLHFQTSVTYLSAGERAA